MRLTGGGGPAKHAATLDMEATGLTVAVGRARQRRGRGMGGATSSRTAARRLRREGLRIDRKPPRGVSVVTVPGLRGRSVSTPPAGAEPVSPLGRMGWCGVFFRTAELGEVGCLTRVDVSPTVGVAEGAGGGTPRLLPQPRFSSMSGRGGLTKGGLGPVGTSKGSATSSPASAGCADPSTS